MGEPILSGAEYYTSGDWDGSSSQIIFSKDNVQLYDILNTLQVGDSVNVFYTTSYLGYGWEVRKDTTLIGITEDEKNHIFSMSGGWTGTDVNGAGAVLGQPSGGPIRFESSFITNGSVPLESGQALIYDKTTETWRPENVSLNIGLLPTLP